ncbi:MAG: hypothetical protein WBW89_00045 [Candidatus Cybelea sp.]
MQNKQQPDPDREILAEIARLEPLAKAEQLSGGRDNPWKGSTEALKDARARLEAARIAREAEVQAEEVSMCQDLLDRREDALPKLAEFDAKLAAFGEGTRDYFARANDIMRWEGLGVRVDGRTGETLIEPLSKFKRHDAWGNVLDEPPIGANKLPVVPAEEWEAVKQYRYLYFQRQGVASELDNINRSLRDTIEKTPALAFVKPRQTVSA